MSAVEARLRARVDELEEEVRQLRAAMDSKASPYAALPISGQQRAVLGMLMRCGLATNEAIDGAMEAALPMGFRGQECRRMHVSNLRRRLGIEIRNAHNTGYWIPPAGKARVRELCGVAS